MVSEISAKFDVNIGFANVYTNTHLRDLVELINSKKREKLVSIQTINGNSYKTPSYMQKWCWNASKDNNMFNMVFAFDIIGSYNIDLIKATFNILIEKFEILRTFYTVHNGDLKQMIVDLPDVRIEVLQVDGEDMIQKFIAAEYQYIFDLSQFPLYRIKLLKSPDGLMILFNIHHIIFDGYSINVFVKNFNSIYNLLYTGKSVSLEYISNNDKFIQNEKDILKDTQAKLFWKSKIEKSQFCFDYNSKNNPLLMNKHTIGSAVNSLKYSKQEIVELLERYKATWFIFFLSILKLIIFELTNRDNILISTNIHNREYSEMNDYIGLFVNKLLLLNKVNIESRFSDFVDEVKLDFNESMKFSRYPYLQIVEDAKYSNMINNDRICDISFFVTEQFDGTNTSTPELIKIVKHAFASSNQPNNLKYNLQVNLNIGYDELKIIIHHKKEYFSDKFVEEMQSKFCLALKALKQQFNPKIKDLFMSVYKN
jgi:hypothetical protein